MNFCAVICEYNPFHNGHLYLLGEARKRSGCDGILCLMSGNFTQRGEAAVLSKYERARHAVLMGADAVLELPVSFAVCSAEIFAKGALHILSALPSVEALAFGCESGTAEEFMRAAKATLSESKQFKAALKDNMKDGVSYVKARTQTVLSFHADIDEALLTSPNNILGTEYCRAILSCGSSILPIPILRAGGGYADGTLLSDFSSAAALRAALRDRSRKTEKLVRKNIPPCVYQSLQSLKKLPYEEAALAALVAAEAEEIALCPDCSEGLENRLKAMTRSNPEYEEMLSKVVSKRYTLSRLKRILAQNLLKIRRKSVKDFLEAPLYAKVLAVKKNRSEEVLSSLKGGIPVIARKSDALALRKEAESCFACDVRANDVYSVLAGERSNEFETLFV